eukprot:TRINITY_DN37129_c0_g1_i1.p1 TRINITY_DN37129_c0_g1~~TRINITY_DN37129_c0_g1_i1.p1  ORF type:complete len:367 (+),score=127.15 TRINITY_DN37129_c0_g1_i1:58-1158(+)
MEKAIAAVRGGTRHLNLVALSAGSSRGDLFSNEVEEKGWAGPEEDAVGARAEAAAHEYAVSTIGAEAVAKHVAECSTLTQITLHGEGDRSIGPDGVAAICKALHKNQSVESLSISCLTLPPASVEAVADALRHHPAMRELRMHRNNLTGGSCRALAPAVRPSALRRLELTGNDIGGSGAESLATALRTGAADLEELVLDDAGVDVPGAQALALLLMQSSRLRCLTARRNSCGDAGAEALAVGLRKNAGLVQLDLAMNDIADVGCAALCEAAETHPRLRSLSFRGNKLHDVGAAAAARLLRSSTTLTSLDLDLNFITETGVGDLAEALAACPMTVENVSLAGNVFTPAECDAYGRMRAEMQRRTSAP